MTVLKKEAVKYGENAVEAHALRRIYTTFRIRDFDTDELTNTIVLTYHQDGLQAAIGPCVIMCHNQCILAPERMVSTYGKNKVTLEAFFQTIDSWLSVFEVQMTADRERIQRLKNTFISEQEISAFIGLLTMLRVAHDSKDKDLSSKVQTYPLTQSKISLFTEDVLVKLKGRQYLTAWELYNIATEYYKPGKVEIPSVVEQNVAMADTLIRFCELKMSADKQLPAA